MSTLGEEIEAPQLTLHINMPVAQRLLANIEEWTSVCCTGFSCRTRGLTPTLTYFDIIPARTIRTKSQKNVFIRICGCWKHSHHICVNSECLCSNAFLLYEQSKINNFIFTSTNKLEYINYTGFFFLEKGGI